MNYVCTVCGSTGAQAVADAKALGLEPELQQGIYTCCQVTEWALEQELAWSEVALEGCRAVEREEAAGALVPVRIRRPQAPKLKKPERRG